MALAARTVAVVGALTLAAVSVVTTTPLATAAPAAAPAAPAAPAALSSTAAAGAGLPSDGVLRPPTRDVRQVERSQATGTPSRALPRSRPNAVPAPPFSFAQSGYVAQSVPAAALPYARTSPGPLTDTGVHDAQGVRMVLIDGTQYNHPVAQAQYGLDNLASYQLTHTQAYLDRAEAQAQRLVDTKVVSRGAWFFPYPFDFALHGLAADTMHAPWYSAMAEGQALSLFVRLYQVTSDSGWLTAADSTAASLSLPSDPALPWVVHVDGSSHLWLDEYPIGPGEQTDLTYNGHMFAAFGLYDYVRQTGDATAASLFDGAVTTVVAKGSAFRTPGWVSSYCLTHHTPAGHYQDIHIDQLLNLYSMTHDTTLAKLSDTFRSDFPHSGSATVRFAKGRYTGYTFSSAGAVTASRTLSLSAASNAPASAYAKIKTRTGLYLKISAGSLTGYWVQEQPNLVEAIGPFVPGSYVPGRLATFPPGTTTAYRFSTSTGLPSASKAIVLSRASSAPVDESATFNAGRYVRVTAGSLSGYWVPFSRVALS